MALKQSTGKNFGWRKDIPDPRDRMHVIPKKWKAAKLPDLVDLRPFCSAVEDQGNLGSCTANALVGIAELLENRLISQKKKPGKFVDLSRRMVYYCELWKEGTLGQDAGAQIRTGAKVFAQIGAANETVWPYIDDVNALFQKPTPGAFQSAKKHIVTGYSRVDGTSANAVMQTLANGYGIAFGFSVPDWFQEEVGATTIMRVPGKDDSFVGGHAVALVGYNLKKKLFLVRNSWGKDWAEGGYFWMPFSVVTNPNLCDDFWVFTDEALES